MTWPQINSNDAPRVVRSLDELVARNLKFPTIYCDPPWRYANTASRGAAANHYPTMSLDELAALPVNLVANENAHLNLWVTSSFLRESFEIMDAWGFTYKSSFVWVKHQMGLGNYWRLSHEYLLLGVRGRMPFRDKSCMSWIGAPRSIHSRKPSQVRELIERVSPGPYLEMFGREEIPCACWTVFGNQVRRSHW